jgi:putative ABC transport system permease protein
MKSRLRLADLLPVSTVGLQTRPARAALSVLGVAIGIAAMVSVLGITRSSQADLLARIDRLGTNLLTVASGRSLQGDDAKLPAGAGTAAARTDGVLTAASTAALASVHVYRTDRMPANRAGGLSVVACDPSLMSTLDGKLAAGRFLDSAITRYPATVLGSEAAQVLGVTDVADMPRVYIGGQWFTVVGILRPVELAPEVDSSALIGFPIATATFGYDGHPSEIYVRTVTDRTSDVADLLARAAKPGHPEEVAVTRPSDLLEARLAITGGATTLFLGLGAVALLVGGIGIANVMVISVLERRNEIGLRRALGAARRHVAVQFLIESLLLGITGGAVGVIFGTAVTYGLAYQRGWQPLIPGIAIAAGLSAAAVIGAFAGLYPALRAARLSPTEALRSL